MNSPSAAALLAHPQKLPTSPSSRALQQIRSVRPIASCASRGSIDNGHDSTSPRRLRTASSHSPAGRCRSSSNTENCPTMYCWVTETSKTRCAISVPRNARSGNKLGPQSAVSPRFAPAASTRGAVSAPSTSLPLWCQAAAQLDTAALEQGQQRVAPCGSLPLVMREQKCRPDGRRQTETVGFRAVALGSPERAITTPWGVAARRAPVVRGRAASAPREACA